MNKHFLQVLIFLLALGGSHSLSGQTMATISVFADDGSAGGNPWMKFEVTVRINYATGQPNDLPLTYTIPPPENYTGELIFLVLKDNLTNQVIDYLPLNGETFHLETSESSCTHYQKKFELLIEAEYLCTYYDPLSVMSLDFSIKAGDVPYTPYYFSPLTSQYSHYLFGLSSYNVCIRQFDTTLKTVNWVPEYHCDHYWDDDLIDKRNQNVSSLPTKERNFINPNPFVNQITFSFKKGDIALEIFDSNGKNVYSKQKSQDTDIFFINTSSWISGVYYFKVYNQIGFVVKKAIKI